MARMVNCVKLGREAEGLDFPPYPGELGKRIYASVSKEAWQQWVRLQTMIINENRLNLADGHTASIWPSRSRNISSVTGPIRFRVTFRRGDGRLSGKRTMAPAGAIVVVRPWKKLSLVFDEVFRITS